MGGLGLSLTEFDNLSYKRKQGFLEMMETQQNRDKQEVENVQNSKN